MDLDAIRADLEQIVREADATIAVMEAEVEEDENETENHSEDNASEMTEADREDALIEAAQERRREAQEALGRLAAGTYGLCIVCSEKIADARLEFRPEAARCLADQEKFEDSLA